MLLTFINLAFYLSIVFSYSKLILYELTHKAAYKNFTCSSIKLNWNNLIIRGLKWKNVADVQYIEIDLLQRLLYFNDILIKSNLFNALPLNTLLNPSIKRDHFIESVNICYRQDLIRILSTNGLLFELINSNKTSKQPLYKINLQLGEWKVNGKWIDGNLNLNYIRHNDKKGTVNFKDQILKIQDQECLFIYDNNNLIIKGKVNFHDFEHIFKLPEIEIKLDCKAFWDETKVYVAGKINYHDWSINTDLQIARKIQNAKDLEQIMKSILGKLKVNKKEKQFCSLETFEQGNVSVKTAKINAQLIAIQNKIQLKKFFHPDLPTLNGWINTNGDFDLIGTSKLWNKNYEFKTLGNFKDFAVNVKKYGNFRGTWNNKSLLLDLQNLKFEWFGNLGFKEKGQKCIIKADAKNITINTQNINADLTWNMLHISGTVKANNKYAIGSTYLMVNFNPLKVTVHGRLRYANAIPWLKEKHDNNNQTPLLDIQLKVDKAQIKPNVFVRSGNFKLLNDDKKLQCDIDMKFNKFQRQRTEGANSRIYVSIIKPKNQPGKITAKADYASKLASLFGADLPIDEQRVSPIVIQGTIGSDCISGTAIVRNLYTTKGLGLLRLIRMISISSLFNSILQLDHNYWPKLEAKWCFEPGKGVKIENLIMYNNHYDLKLNGFVNLIAQYVDFKGSVVPKTLLGRLGFTRLALIGKLLEIGVEFEVFGPFGNVQTTIKNKTSQLLPVFIPL